MSESLNPPRTNILDHIVYRAETGILDSTINRFRSLGFNVIPGGTHSGGLTHNALIILPDGVYIELIAFLHHPSYYPPASPERLQRENHPWANVQVGWLEYAHLDTAVQPSNTYDIINKRAPLGVVTICDPPKPGGRKRPDGMQIKWTTTFPVNDYQGGKIPFFCQDLTPRDLRVPTEPPSNSSHPNRAQGIARITVLTSEEDFQKQVQILIATLGSQPIATDARSLATWALSRRPNPNPNTNDETSTYPTLELKVPQNGTSEERFVLRTGGGIAQVVFWAELPPVSLESSGSPPATVSFETRFE